MAYTTQPVNYTRPVRAGVTTSRDNARYVPTDNYTHSDSIVLAVLALVALLIAGISFVYYYKVNPMDTYNNNAENTAGANGTPATAAPATTDSFTGTQNVPANTANGSEITGYTSNGNGTTSQMAAPADHSAVPYTASSTDGNDNSNANGIKPTNP